MTPGLKSLVESISEPGDADLEARIRARLDSLTKPRGSLGRLEGVALRYALARGEAIPAPPRPALAVFCADHGVVVEGVSAYPQAVTAQMAANFSAGGAAICVLCRRLGIETTIVDVGVVAELPPELTIVREKIVPGTRNLAREAAMSRDEALRALEMGARIAAEAVERGATLLAAGDMGIGNTTAATALGCAFTGRTPAELAGPGAGLDAEGVRRKAAVIERALALHAEALGDPLETLRRLGGLEIAAIAGYYLGAAAGRTLALVDGFIATAAALAAVQLAPAARGRLLFCHRSAEPGHDALLEALAAEPLLDLRMRLGEGTGAALAMETVACAVALYREMATFESAGVADA
jgi:nicotinate-nucleotide--dimethylbenzimidazole phosphoribosyltransferase